jgi:hypothetical protein
MQSKSSALALVILGLCFAGIAYGSEKKISKSALPPAVQKTADEQSKGSTVRGYTTDTEDGKLEYEVQMVASGHSKAVTIAPDGKLMEVEEQVMIDALPTNVKAGLESKAGRGKITKVESLTKHGSIVAYEAQVLTASKHSEIQVGPNGAPLDHEE